MDARGLIDCARIGAYRPGVHLRPPAQYERICNICGTSWLVDRRVASPSSPSGPRWVWGETAKDIRRTLGPEMEASELFRICPQCGNDDFRQHAAPAAGPTPAGGTAAG